MIRFSLEEAQLFRCLGGLFGTENVIPNMSLLAVCGGEVPDTDSELSSRTGLTVAQLESWARENQLLFTVIDSESNPRLVVNFDFEPEENCVEPARADLERFVVPFLEAAQIRYISISRREFSLVLDPEVPIDFIGLMQGKVGIETSS